VAKLQYNKYTNKNTLTFKFGKDFVNIDGIILGCALVENKDKYCIAEKIIQVIINIYAKIN